MKTIAIIYTLFFFFSVSTSIALNDGDQPVKNETFLSAHKEYMTLPENLAPVTPREADFQDEAEPMTLITLNPAPNELAPVTPSEADFESVPDNAFPLTGSLIPVVPAEADFADTH